MSTITVPEPITSSFDLADRLRQLRIRIAGRLRSALATSRLDWGCGATWRNRSRPRPPRYRFPVCPLVEADLPVLLAVDDATSPEDQYEIACRRALAAKRIAGAFVAVDERDGDPVTSSGCSARPTMTSSGGSRASRTLPPTRRCSREPTPGQPSRTGHHARSHGADRREGGDDRRPLCHHLRRPRQHPFAQGMSALRLLSRPDASAGRAWASGSSAATASPSSPPTIQDARRSSEL